MGFEHILNHSLYVISACVHLPSTLQPRNRPLQQPRMRHQTISHSTAMDLNIILHISVSKCSIRNNWTQHRMVSQHLINLLVLIDGSKTNSIHLNMVFNFLISHIRDGLHSVAFVLVPNINW